METGTGGQQASIKQDEEEMKRVKRAKLKEMNAELAGQGMDRHAAEARGY